MAHSPQLHSVEAVARESMRLHNGSRAIPRPGLRIFPKKGRILWFWWVSDQTRMEARLADGWWMVGGTRGR